MVEETGAPSPPLARPRRRILRALCLGGVIFFSGAVVGCGLTLGMLWARLARQVQHPEIVPDRIARRVTRTLDLSESQERQVRARLQERFRALREIQREARPRVDSELEGLRKDVEAVLTPEQARKWNRRFLELRARWLPRVPPAKTPPDARAP